MTIPHPKLTIPVQLTVLRILLVPGFGIAVYYQRFAAAFIIFTVAALTDAIDGLIARFLHQETVFGSYLDPLADKFLLLTAFIVYTFSKGVIVPLHAWVTLSLIFREIIILGGVLVIYVFSKREMKIKPTILGKLTTIVLAVTIFEVALANFLVASGYSPKPYFTATSIFSHIAVAFITLSGLDYVRIGLPMLITHSHTNKRSE